MNTIFVLSDGSGKTAAQSINAALTQFSDSDTRILVRGNVRSKEQATRIVREAAACDGLVIHTVVTKELRDYILEVGRTLNVEAIDLMGPLLAGLSQRLSDSPSEKPGLFHELNKAYFQRMESMEFAIRHDDGQKTSELPKAHLVLVGVSRTFKTPLSMYLAFKGWLVANVPIVLELEPPDILLDLPPNRVFGLTTNANCLAMLRQVRQEHFGEALGNYADPVYVRKELAYAHRIFDQQTWNILDVTNKPIEEIATQILSIAKDTLDS